jgi:hypothetical protein
MKKTILILILLAAGTSIVKCQETFNYDSLSTFRILQTGLETNFNIKLKRYVVNGSMGQMTTAKGIFNPQLTMEGYGFYGQDPTMTFQDSYSLKGQLLVPTRSGIKFYTGFKLSNEIDIITGAPGIFPSQYLLINESGMWAGFYLPLLRDLGRNNSNNVTFLSAKMMYKAQSVSFNDGICQFIRDALISYYNTYQCVTAFKILRDANKDAHEYVADIQALIDNEQLPKTEVYRAQAYQLNISQQFSLARNDIVNSFYDLITSLGIKGTLVANTLPTFLDSLPDPSTFPWDKYSAYIIRNIDSMVVNTPYFKSQDLLTSSSQIIMNGAKFNQLNDLNLDFRFMYFGSTVGEPISQFGDSFSSGLPGSALNITLSYKIPFLNEERKGDYLSKLSTFEYNNTQLQRVKFEAKSKVYKLLSDIGNLMPLFKNQIDLAEIEKKTFQSEVQKFDMGASTQIDMINTYMDYNKALLNVESGRLAIINRVINLKYLIGDFPVSSDELVTYNPWVFNTK